MSTLKDRKKKLEQEIIDRQEELRRIENIEKKGNDSITPLDEYTDEDKINFFNKMYEYATYMLKDFEETGFFREDNEHYSFEEVVKILNIKNPNKFWDYWNSLYN